MATTTLKVDGMTCSGCSGSVTDVLSKLDGVESVEVTLDPGQAVVQHGAIDPTLLVQTVEAAGFDAALLTSG